MSEIPGLEEEVIARAPPAEAPKIMLMEATSLSAWMKHPSASDICLEKYSGISFWGVMG